MAEVAPKPLKPVTPSQLRAGLDTTAFAFRGYNTTNLGLTPELLAHPLYGPVVASYLARGSAICSEVKGRSVDLIQRIKMRRETSLSTYDEAITLIVAIEIAQLAILREFFAIDLARSQVAFGFSLGEIAALVAGNVLEMEDALRIPLQLSDDCVELAADVTLAVLFSRRGKISEKAISRICQEINASGDGVIGVSAFLAPNSLLLIGQNATLDKLSKRSAELSSERVYLRRNDYRWPPLHTPIVWERNIPNRVQYLLHKLPVRVATPQPPIFSLVTASLGYDEYNTREIIGLWVDRPQRLWSAVDYSLSSGVEIIVHVGPQPNIFPATFDRLADNILMQTKDSVRMRALSGIVNRPWLQNILPKRAALMRAPMIRHVVLEEWLLAHAPA